MEIKEFMFVVSSHYPLTNQVVEERYYMSKEVNKAMACFNELCARSSETVVEFGVMTLCKNPCDDSYKVIKTRW